MDSNFQPNLFLDQLGEMGPAQFSRLDQSLQRQVRDNGVSFNLFADPQNPQRPWSVDLFPLVLNAQEWAQIASGVAQRARVLEALMKDVYHQQTTLERGLVPASLILGHHGYLRAMHGVLGPESSHLHILAFDLTRDDNGRWLVVSQRTHAPAGLGYLLENRLLISRQFPQAFEQLKIQRLASTYRSWIESLRRSSGKGQAAHLAFLTPGPAHETYFEHAYLARYLGLSLVEGADLTVRDQRLFLRTLRGLTPIDGLINHVPQALLDPLELQSNSTWGVPGLLQVLRAGHLMMANAPGAEFAESSALLGFMPGLCEALLGQTLELASLDTWWCGEEAAMHQALSHLEETVIKPSQVDGSFASVFAHELTEAERQDWAQRIQQHPLNYCLQRYQTPMRMRGWDHASHQITDRACMLRVFALRDSANSWRVLPGGLARIAPTAQSIASMQRGGSSADVWVHTHEPVDATSLLSPTLSAQDLMHRKRIVTSRSAENLFWLGRYSERSENVTRWIKLCLETLSNTEEKHPQLLQWLDYLSSQQGLIPASNESLPLAAQLIEHLNDKHKVTSLGLSLQGLRQTAASLRERLSSEQWRVIEKCLHSFESSCLELQAAPQDSVVQAMQLLDDTSASLAAITGAQTDRMTRDDGWQLLSIGRHIERLSFLSESLIQALHLQTLSPHIEPGQFHCLLTVFDSTITYHAQFQQYRDLGALLSLIVLDEDNPRSLAWVCKSLRARLSKLAQTPMGVADPLAQSVPSLTHSLEQLCQTDEQHHLFHLMDALQACSQAAWKISDAVTAKYFIHTDNPHLIGV